ncbi:MAG: WhiB family transcriptional regulator [Actinomycetota bacterium]
MDTTWRRRGACVGLEAGIFYPVTDEDGDAAKAVCDACDVQVQCLEFALTVREKDGVWGGATEKERRRIVRQRRRAAAAARARELQAS